MQNSEASNDTNKCHVTESEVNQTEKHSTKIVCIKIRKILDSQSSKILAALMTQFDEKNLRFQK